MNANAFRSRASLTPVVLVSEEPHCLLESKDSRVGTGGSDEIRCGKLTELAHYELKGFRLGFCITTFLPSRRDFIEPLPPLAQGRDGVFCDAKRQRERG